MRPTRLTLTLLACVLAAPPAFAQTLYKLIDKDGKVTYAEKPPKDYHGKVIRIDVNPEANRAAGGKPPVAAGPSDDTRAGSPVIRRSIASEERVREARDKLDAARRELQDARDNPREGEVTRMGNVGGGTRPVFTAEYEKRLAQLEQAVREAEAEVRAAESNR